MPPTSLIIDYPERNPDLMYATRFSAPDPVLFFAHAHTTCLVLSHLELARARREATVDRLLSLADYQQKARQVVGGATLVDVVDTLCRERKVRALCTPTSTAAIYVDGLRQRGYTVTLRPKPFFPQRFIKSPREQRYIADAQRAVFKTFRQTETILRATQIRRGYLYYRGKVLTTEWLRAELSALLYHQGYATPEALIIACGTYGVDPHERGAGPLRPHQAIVCDFTPQSLATHYFGDATRTYCRGKATPALRRQYATVCTAQQLGLRMLRAGVNGKTVHTAIADYFTAEGYPTRAIGGRMQGFFHGTGHGIGLEVHEEPQRIAGVDFRLEAGQVLSVEPGLYYIDTGGVRIEDLVVITTTGCRVLGGPYPRRLEIL